MEHEIIDILNSIIIEKENKSIVITDNTDIINEIGLDSLAMVDFMLKLEEKFEIEFDFNQFDLSNFSSVKNLSNAILNMKK